MDKLTPVDWFTLITFLVAVLSLFFNFIQWRKEVALQNAVTLRTVAGMNAGYQPLWRIAQICDWLREHRDDNGGLPVPEIYGRIYEITGNADAGRSTMNAICHKLTGEHLHYESAGAAPRKGK